jgi:proline dehydrogenase
MDRLKQFLWACWERFAKVVARSYVVGPSQNDALEACRQLAANRFTTTVCHWKAAEESPQKVAAAYIAAIEAIGKEKLDCYLSTKAPDLGFDLSLLSQVWESGRNHGIRLLFDSLAPEEADRTFALIAEALPQHPDLGCTLPGRWGRSLRDADWAVDKKLYVRVVKGQWADPAMPKVDLRKSFLAVIDRLAGGARHVAVATHDAPLAQMALDRLLIAKTPCTLELLYGLPWEPARSLAVARGVGVRMYVPYGQGWLPYTISQVYEKPRILWWILRDLLNPRSKRLP